MAEIRSTVMRLERQIQLDQAQALTSLHHSFEDLAGSLLSVGRERGYLGADPLGALSHLVAPSPRERRLGEAVLALWTTFFSCFRADEAAFEAARFQERAGPVREHLAALPPGGWPDPELSVAMLDALSTLWEERHQAISERLDGLIKDLGDQQAKLGSLDLQRAHQSDEMQRALQVVSGALAEMGEQVDPATPPNQILAKLIGRYRRELAGVRKQAGEATGARRALSQALLAAATGAPLPAVHADDLATVNALRSAFDQRRLADERLREARAQLARAQAETRELMEEVGARDRKLARYEFGTVDAGDEDERLGLYRRAFAELEAGRDAKALLTRVRELERVIILESDAEQQAQRILDRQVSEVVKCLLELRAVSPITDDPKRLRPRLLHGSRYDFKRLAGQAQAARDAARDLLEFLSRARWSAGVAGLSKDLPKLQRVFREMVKLVATWRDKLGDPPPASVTIRIEQGTSIIALPALLAGDLETLLKRKGRAAAQAASSIVPVMEECVALYHKCLEKARGEAIAREPAGKRESANQSLLRLAAELSRLGGTLETIFGDAASSEFILDPADSALMNADHVMLLALQQVDVACDVLAALPGAPAADFPALPSGRGIDRLLAACRARTTWLEEVARYRFELRAQGA